MVDVSVLDISICVNYSVGVLIRLVVIVSSGVYVCCVLFIWCFLVRMVICIVW